MPPPSSGGVALIEMLNILEPFDLKAKGRCSRRGAAPARSKRCAAPTSIARATSAIPTSSQVPVDEADSRRSTRRTLAASIDPATSDEQRRARQGHRHAPPAHGAGRDDALLGHRSRPAWPSANTYTLEGGFGSHVVVKGAGFLLNNEMGDFNKKPGDTNARRRHRHAGEPDRAGQADAQLDDADDRGEGTASWCWSPARRAAARSSTRCSPSCSASTEFGLNVRDAVDAPRMHHQWLPDAVDDRENAASTDEVLQKLRAMGHTVKVGGAQGDAQLHRRGIAGWRPAYGVQRQARRAPTAKALGAAARLTSTASST